MKTLLYFSLLLLSLPLRATAQDYDPFTNFPAPASGSFTVVGTALPDGRLIAWNGDGVFAQYAPDTNFFTEIADGYAGDPAFILYEPAHNSVLLGAGFSGNIYRLDLDQIVDFTPSSIVVNTPHYSAALLGDSLLLVDAGKPGFTGSELRVISLGSKSQPQVVVAAAPNAKAQVVEKPPFTYSSSLGMDTANGIVYSMSAFGTPEELRYFTVTELLQAYNTSTPLDWSADGTLIGSAGQFNSGGVAGILQNGFLVIPGFGSIQIVNPRLDNPALATIVDEFDPTGLGDFYAAIYNAVTGIILAVDGSGNVFAPALTLTAVPAAGLAGLLLLGGTVAALGASRTRRS